MWTPLGRSRRDGRRHLARSLWLVMSLGLGCRADTVPDVDGGAAGATSVTRRVKQRTVSIELLQTVERVLEQTADGSFQYGTRVPIGGVEVCVAMRRPAFASFEPFERIEPPEICTTSVEGEAMRLEGVPSDSDLIITYTKDGYMPEAGTFRTDEHDVALPFWSDGPVYYTPLVREHAVEPWLEPAPPDASGEGVMAAWAQAVGDWEVGYGREQLVADEVPGVAPAADVVIRIETPDGHLLSETLSLRDRPRFVSLPADLYRVRFTHPVLEVVPTGVQEQFLTTGLPTDDFETIEVPVLAGHLSLALVDAYCPLPSDMSRQFTDLATCTLSPVTAMNIP